MWVYMLVIKNSNHFMKVRLYIIHKWYMSHVVCVRDIPFVRQCMIPLFQNHLIKHYTSKICYCERL